MAAQPFVFSKDRPAPPRQPTGRLPVLSIFAGTGCIGLIFTLAGLLSMGFGYFVISHEIEQARQLETEGIETTATLMDKRFSRSDDSTSYYVSYRFIAVDDTIYTDEADVNSAFYNAASAGQEIRIRYARSDPGNSGVVGHIDSSASLETFQVIWMVFSGFFSLLGIFFVVRLLRGGNKGLRKLRQPSVNMALNQGYLNGELRNVISFEDGNDYWLTIEYTFTTPDTGQRVDATHNGIYNHLRKRALPAPGAPVLVRLRKREYL
ncbi:MAG: DUF3592 domain-containing protein [Anaerolineae bacterium]|nr:DUF3592 domain-containing protein [Anaerolineae bacterium]